MSEENASPETPAPPVTPTPSAAELHSRNLRFILTMCFVPVIILVLVFCVAFLLVAVIDKQIPPGDAVIQLAKAIMDFIVSLVKVLLGG